MSEEKKIDLKILKQLILEDFHFVAELEYRFAALEAGLGKDIRKRLKKRDYDDWRFDLAIPDKKIAVEIEGGVFTKGRHSRGMGMIKDMKKYNAAVVLGWRLVRYTHSHHTYSDILEDIKKIIFKF